MFHPPENLGSFASKAGVENPQPPGDRKTINDPAASAKLGGKPEITRFKGLGEISPKEFNQFIGKDIRLSQVEYAPKSDSQQILSFYMGKNTPERKDYIMENLVVTVEE